METIKQILINYIPSLSVLLGFVASCFGVLKALKKSDLTKISLDIKDENNALRKEIKQLIDYLKMLAQENEELKKLNKQLLFELTKLSEYKEE